MAYFTISKMFLLPSFDPLLKERQKLDAYLEILEESNIAKYFIDDELRLHKKEVGGRPTYNPYHLFATIAYAFSKHSGSVRKIEESINYDLRFIYLMEQERPTYATISKFLNNIIVKFHDKIYTSIVQTIIRKYDITIDDIFIDGSKFEANANKYKFVWKPLISIAKFLTAKDVALFLNKLLKQIEDLKIDVHHLQKGRGHRQIKIVTDYFTLQSYLLRTLEYEEKTELCGPKRNSYYKTDIDATAMTLKVDYYSGLGSNMHAAYNIQIAVSKGIILDYYVGQEQNDMKTLIPFLTSFSEHYEHYPKRLCTDSGYASYHNYQFIFDHNIENYIKYQEWQQEREGRKIELFTIDQDYNLHCLNREIAPPLLTIDNRKPRRAGNYFYEINDCKYCRHKEVCSLPLKTKINDRRVFEASPFLYFAKINAKENLLSPKGIEMRINRSSQVEGAFGVIKQDMNFVRFRRRGIENVRAEFMLICLGYVINKLFSLIDGTAKLDYWIAPENLQPQIMPKQTLKKTLKKRTMGTNEKIRRDYKKKGR